LLGKLRITRLGEPAAAARRNQSMGVSEATRHDQRTTVTVDRDGIIRQWGDAVTDVVGHSADDTVGRDLNVLIPPALRAPHWWGFDRAMNRGRLNRETFKLPALCKDGRIVVAHANMELIPGRGGDPEGAVVTFTGVGAPWQGAAWRAVLAPIDFTRRIFQRARSRR
jgi:PAS domain S-box-containing protein